MTDIHIEDCRYKMYIINEDCKTIDMQDSDAQNPLRNRNVEAVTTGGQQHSIF